jgi:mRNA interferase RelE/StbE
MKKPKPPLAKPAPAPISPPTYTVKLSRLAQKQLDKLPDAATERIATKLFELATDPRPSGVKKLKGQEGYRIRVGDYRVLYSIFDAVLLVEIVKVGQRGNFYDE